MVKKTRPAFIEEKPEVEAEANPTVTDLAKDLRRLKDMKENIEEQLKKTNGEIDEASTKLADLMETQGVDSFKVAGVGSVYIQTLNRPTVVDKDALIVWLDSRGMSDCAPRSCHHKKLESIVKELLEDSQPLPACLNVFQQKRALIRRS